MVEEQVKFIEPKLNMGLFRQVFYKTRKKTYIIAVDRFGEEEFRIIYDDEKEAIDHYKKLMMELTPCHYLYFGEITRIVNVKFVDENIEDLEEMIKEIRLVEYIKPTVFESIKSKIKSVLKR